MATQVKVPTLGESVTEATVGEWLKQVGDAVAADEPIASLETDKVAVEVPSPVAGVLTELAVDLGATVEVGAVIATVEEGATGKAPTPAPAAAPAGAAPTKKAPVVMRTKEYLDHTVLPILREAIRALVKVRPDDPYDFLIDFIKENKPK